jgi:hypothetical protein
MVTGVFFKFGVEVGVELSIVNALYRLRITDQLFKSYALYEWCDLNRLSNAYFDAKLKKQPLYSSLFNEFMCTLGSFWYEWASLKRE